MTSNVTDGPVPPPPPLPLPGRRPASALDAGRATAVIALWVVGALVQWVVGVAAKEECSARYGSARGVTVLGLEWTCDALAAATGALVWVGGPAVIGAATLAGAWRRWGTSALAGVVVAALPVGSVVVVQRAGLI